MRIIYFGGPRCGQVVKLPALQSFGIWLKGGVYRYDPERGAYVWREVQP
jgi:hypothetical protein